MFSLLGSVMMAQRLAFLVFFGLGALAIFLVMNENKAIAGKASQSFQAAVVAEQSAVHAALSEITTHPSASVRAVRARFARTPGLLSSVSLLRGSSYSDDWLAAALAAIRSRGHSNGSSPTVLELSQSVYYAAASEFLTLGLSLSSSGLLLRRHIPGVDAAGTERLYDATVASNGTLLLSPALGITEMDPTLASCLQDVSCNGTATDYLDVLNSSLTGDPVPAVRFTVLSSLSPVVRIAASVAISSEYLDELMGMQDPSPFPAEASDGVFALCDERGFVISSSVESERARRITCLTQPSLPEQRTCLRLHASAFPDPGRIVAGTYAGFAQLEYLTDVIYRQSGSTYSAAAPIAFGGRHWALLFSAEVPPKSLALVISVIVAAFVFEVTATFAFRRTFGRSVFMPMQELHKLMDQVAMLNFAEVEAVEQTRQADKLSVAEIRELSSCCFEMSSAISSFALYVPKEVIRELQDSDNLRSRVMTTRLLTFIFIDIANFTTMCEALQVDQLAELAEKYFSVATRTCTVHGATIDKFIGDAIFGFWGAPLDYTAQGYSACCTALHLQTVVDRLQPTFAERGLTLMVRMGLHRGHSLVGNIGCESRITYTAIGVTPSIAVKLEGLNKRFGTLMILSEAVKSDAESVRPDLFVTRLIGAVAKRDSVPIRIYELCGVRREAAGGKTEVSQRERHRRKRVTPSDSGQETLSVHDQASTVQVSSHATGSSLGGEKFALLSEDEELTVIKQSYHLDPEVVVAINVLSDAADAYLSMRFEQAVAIMQTAIRSHHLPLLTIGLRVPALEAIAAQYEKCVRQRPTERQFAGGVINV